MTYRADSSFSSDRIIQNSLRDKFALQCNIITTSMSELTIFALNIKPCIVMEPIKQGETS